MKPAAQARNDTPADMGHVSFACPGCGQALRARADLAGKSVQCPQCGRSVPIPAVKISAGGGRLSSILLGWLLGGAVLILVALGAAAWLWPRPAEPVLASFLNQGLGGVAVEGIE